MTNFFELLREAWRERGKLGDGSKQQGLSEFMPAALELQETPPNPLVRWLAWTLITLFILTLLWAIFGKVDVVASAEGKIIPGSRVKQIQPLDKGVIKAIHVKEGQYVKEGDPLIELDRTITAADQARMQQELHNASLNLAGSEALQALIADQQNTAEKNSQQPKNQQHQKIHQRINQHKKPVAASELALVIDEKLTLSASEILLHQQKTWEQWQQYQAQLSSLHSALTKAQSEKIANLETIKKLEQTLPMVTKRATALHSLYQKNMASEAEYLELEQQRIERTQDLATQQQIQQQLIAAINEAQQQINALKADTSSKLLAQIADSRNQLATITEELVKARDMNDKQILYAPVSGYVQQLAVNTIGGVVTEAQQLMIVVPEEENLEVQVMLGNQDIGFVQSDMPAEIKIHTFPFTKYGLIDATVTHISDDAILDEKLGLVYAMHLKMHKSTIRVEAKDVKLIPGMAVTAEVKTTQRRVIEYFLSPLLKYKQESIRER
ncbi:HlyD family type I secretion periplasmic adaptor subunit [Cellvibrio sp. KY-GH-1]|uniref:HlyD family type I secretion periplasmic adaptor subunit n=1 Tax=Cellvibrio sp. KY-GH-1 TaxID=2303332 RepID=UPI00124699C5|nr:HlyD family type I secretion periplasmic adaptor subunit [Cellvibrio sp. KY-GH-1]QEY16257.1 HlyD family type I secretion periplasmic adaptor subunit [Cellvibrio sp. KY-GH-1]